MTLLLRLAALFFRALSAFDRWLADADPGEDRADDLTALMQPESWLPAGWLLPDAPTVPLSVCEIDTFARLTDPLEAEIERRLR